MKIAGLQKTSLIDYPGHIVSTIFTQGCNMQCPYCHNPVLISPDRVSSELLPQEILFDFLSRRRNLIDGLCITGGEPTVQPGLIDFIQTIKSKKMKVKLDTNGSNPDILKLLIQERLLDYLAMDIKGPLDKYKDITGYDKTDRLMKSIHLIMESGLDYEFRTTVVPGLHNPEDIHQLGKIIKGARNYYLQNFRPVNTLDPSLEKKRGFPRSVLEKFSKNIKPYVKKVEIRSD